MAAGDSHERVEVDLQLGSFLVPGAVLDELYAHAREVFPEECCGLVISAAPERFGAVRRCANEMTLRHAEDPQAFPRDNRAGYFMAPRDVLEVNREAEQRGEQISAVYHSHVGERAYLSKLDLEYALHPAFPFPYADQIVLSVLGAGVHEAGIFRRHEGQYLGQRVDRR